MASYVHIQAKMRSMQTRLHFFIFLAGLSFGAKAQTPEDEILKTYKVDEYTVQLVKALSVTETTLEVPGNMRVEPPMSKPRPFNLLYFVYKEDSLIAQLPYKEGDCKLYFDERKKVQGFYYLSHATILNICTSKVEKLAPPDLSWLKQPMDSITIYPLDSVLDPYNYQGQRIVISDYPSRKPERLSEQHTKDMLFLLSNPRPLGFAPPSMPRIEHYKVVFYTGAQTQEIYIYYDMFYYQTWVYSMGYSIQGTYNVGKMIWEKHEASKTTEAK